MTGYKRSQRDLMNIWNQGLKLRMHIAVEGLVTVMSTETVIVAVGRRVEVPDDSC